MMSTPTVTTTIMMMMVVVVVVITTSITAVVIMIDITRPQAFPTGGSFVGEDYTVFGFSDVDLDLRGSVYGAVVVVDGGDNLLDFLGDRRRDVGMVVVRGERMLAVGGVVVVGAAGSDAEREEEEEEDDGGPYKDSDDHP